MLFEYIVVLLVVGSADCPQPQMESCKYVNINQCKYVNINLNNRSLLTI